MERWKARLMLLAVVIFIGALLVIASEKVDRTKIALLGALLVVLTQTIDQEHAIESVDSNIGGTATLIGDPPNILIAGATGLSFGAFAANLAPISAFAFVVVTGMLYLVFRSRLQIAPEARDRVLEIDARKSIEDVAELKRTLPVLELTILAFFVHSLIGVEPATVALAGATVMLLLTRQTVEEALRGIEWPTLFFFIGVFVMVGALEATGAIREVADAMRARRVLRRQPDADRGRGERRGRRHGRACRSPIGFMTFPEGRRSCDARLDGACDRLYRPAVSMNGGSP